MRIFDIWRSFVICVLLLFTFDFDDESGPAVMLARCRRVLQQPRVMTLRISVSEIEAYLAVMRLINVALPVLTEWTQGTGVAP